MYSVYRFKYGTGGVVKHPADWQFSGYNEIQNPRKRYTLIDYKGLSGLISVDNINELKKHLGDMIQESLEREINTRESKWTESVAIGSKAFVEETREHLGVRCKGRNIIVQDDNFTLQEAHEPYNCSFSNTDNTLKSNNTYTWNNSY